MPRFRRLPSLPKFAALHGSNHNHFNQERILIRRPSFGSGIASPLLSPGGPVLHGLIHAGARGFLRLFWFP